VDLRDCMRHAGNPLLKLSARPQPPFSGENRRVSATGPSPDLANWIERYGRAWEDADADGAAALFTEDAVYRSSPFREPHVGRDAIRAYSADATGTRTRVRFGRPVEEANRAAVEWWATYIEAEEGEITLPGCLILQFASDGRCEELRETWNYAAGAQRPPPGGVIRNRSERV
jgi:uncharacterized protein (TIGR02246 family)